MSFESEDVAAEDFDRARRRALAARVRSILTGRRDELLSYDEVRRLVAPATESCRGVRAIRVDRIVGSEGRTPDFDGSFLPRQKFLRHRWQSIDAAHLQEKTLPPIKVYELGGVFFVRDGNHRVSVARAHKWTFIDAEVVQVSSHVELAPGMSLKEVAAAAVAVA